MSNKATVQQFYLDFQQGNIPSILSKLSDNIVWDVHGPAIIPYAGLKNSKEGVMDFFISLKNSTTFEKFEPEAYLEDGDKVVALGVAHFTTLSTQKQGVNRWAMAWTFTNGIVEHFENYIDSYVIAETFK